MLVVYLWEAKLLLKFLFKQFNDLFRVLVGNFTKIWLLIVVYFTVHANE